MENFEQNVVTLVKGDERFTLINENGKTRIDCYDENCADHTICQTDRAFTAFCNTMVTLLGWRIDMKGGVR